MEAQECIIQKRWLDLASLVLASADVIFSKASEKGIVLSCFSSHNLGAVNCVVLQLES